MVDLPFLRRGDDSSKHANEHSFSKDEGDEDDWTYVVAFSPKGENAGWERLEDWRGMKEPVTETTFELNVENLREGTYRLFRVDGEGKFRQVQGGKGWKIENETEEKDPEVRRLERKVDRLLDEKNGGAQDAESMEAEMNAIIKKSALSSEEFMKRHGDKLALAAFDIEPDSGDDGEDMSFEDWQESPVFASFYDLINNPEKAEGLGSAAGGIMENFMQGMEGDSGGRQTEPIDQQAEEAHRPEEKKSEMDNIQGFEDLSDEVEPPSKKKLTEAERKRQQVEKARREMEAEEERKKQSEPTGESEQQPPQEPEQQEEPDEQPEPEPEVEEETEVEEQEQTTETETSDAVEEIVEEL